MIKKALDLISRWPHPAIDRALAHALPSADPETLGAIASAILDRQPPPPEIAPEVAPAPGSLPRSPPPSTQTPGHLALIEQFHRLPLEIQQRIVARAPSLTPALRRAAARTRSQAAENAVTIIAQARLAALAYLVTGVLRHGDAARRDAAGRALVHLALCTCRWAAVAQGPPLSSRQSAYVASAVAEAVVHFGQHQTDTPLIAYLWLLPRPIPEVTQALTDPTHPAVAPLARLLARPDETMTRRALLPLARLPSLTAAATEGLRHCVAGSELDDALAHHPLLATPALRRALSHTPRPEQLCPSPAQVGSIDPQAQRGLVDLLDALPIAPTRKLTILNDWLTTLGPAGRFAIARRVAAMTAQDATGDAIGQILTRLTDDLDPAVARLALRRLIRLAPPTLPDLLARQVNADDPSIARLARRHLGPVGFDRLWAAWPKLTHTRRIRAAEALTKIDPRFHTQIGRKIRSKDRQAVLRGLHIAGVLRQGARFEDDLIRLARGRDRVTAASAARALGSARSEPATQALEQLFDHPDPRVRANAIEAWPTTPETGGTEGTGGTGGDGGDGALDRRQRQIDRLAVMAQNETNRARANAIRALLACQNTADHDERPIRPPLDPAAALDTMLQDPRPEHRASALWVADDARVVALSPQLKQMAAQDPDPAIRTRAQQVLENMLQALAPQDVRATTATRSPHALARIEGRHKKPYTQQGAA